MSSRKESASSVVDSDVCCDRFGERLQDGVFGEVVDAVGACPAYMPDVYNEVPGGG